MRKDKHGRHSRAMSGDRRVARAAIALSAATLLGAGVTPVAHAAPPAPRSLAVSDVSLLADITDPEAETAAIELLKATYFNDVDTKNWNALRSLFTPNAVVDTTGSYGPLFPNRDSFILFTSLTLSAINTRHQGYDPVVDLTSDTTASVVWTMQDRLSLAGLITIHGFGHYTDNYEEVNGQWLITYSKLTRTGFQLEFPAFQNFYNGLTSAYNSGGVLAALTYAVPALVAIPVNAVKNLLGALNSNFGGPPTKADPITVPPGSTGVTTEPPGITSTAATAAASKKTLAAPAAASTNKKGAVSAATSVAAVATSASSVGAKAKTPKTAVDSAQDSGTGVGTESTTPSSHTTDSTTSATSSGSAKDSTTSATSSGHAKDSTTSATSSGHAKGSSKSTKSTHTKG